MANHAYEIPEGSWVPNFPFEIGKSWQNIFQNHENHGKFMKFTEQSLHYLHLWPKLNPLHQSFTKLNHLAILGKSPGWSMDDLRSCFAMGFWCFTPLKNHMQHAAVTNSLDHSDHGWIMDVPFSSIFQQSPDNHHWMDWFKGKSTGNQRFSH